MPKIAQANVNRDATASERDSDLTDVARETAERTADAARESTRLVQTAAADTRQTAHHSAEASAEAGRMFVDILGEQTRHNLEAVGALSRAVQWREVVDVQRDFIEGSFDRMNRLGECYRRAFRVGTTSAPSSFRL